MTRGRRRALGVAALLVAVTGWDLARPPARQFTARAELAAIAQYRRWLSPTLGAVGVRCRFEPSCSRYAEAAIRSRGALVGTARALGRIARCGPWTAPGTVDLPQAPGRNRVD